MMNKLLSKIPALLLAVVVGLVCSSPAFGAATIAIQNVDKPGEGFNDPTPAAPVGGNNGTTVGQQRLIAFQYAASIWGATLSSGPVIVVRASWAALECTANAGTLGSAGTISVESDFTNAPLPGTLYSSALANALSGTDLNEGTAEIRARFNMKLGTPGCLENSSWYYGLDTNHVGGQINLATVLLHEFSHGLGFQTFTSSETGAQAFNMPSIYDRFLFDNTTGKSWVQMTNAERSASAVNTGNLVWTGQQVGGSAGFLTNGKDAQGRVQMYTPSPLKKGSSVSHWNTLASPNLLMEPNISFNLSHSVTAPQDLTYALIRDLGWCTTCPPLQPSTITPPANDNIAAAQLISGCTGSVAGTNSGATHEFANNISEPSHSPDDDGGGGSVWYQWQAPSSGSVTLTTAGSNYDTLLAVYTGTSMDTLKSVLMPDGTAAKNDDVDPGVIRTSTLTFNVTAGTTYKIAVDGWDGDRGNITLNWTLNNCTQGAALFVLTEEGTSRAVALDSVTQLRGAFPIIGNFNFSVDKRTRVMIFTTNHGLNPGDDVSGLSVEIQGIPQFIERVGTQTGVTNASYITIRLDTGSTPVGNNLPLVVKRNGVASNTATIDIKSN